MRKQEEDRQLKKILQDGLMRQAPTGMVDRIMATIAVSPARRLSIKPVEPKPFLATLVPIFTGIMVAIAAFVKPQSRYSFSLDQYINFNINPIWIAPVIVISLTVWGYVIISKRTNIIDNSNF